jgi:hypothetical protein
MMAPVRESKTAIAAARGALWTSLWPTSIHPTAVATGSRGSSQLEVGHTVGWLCLGVKGSNLGPPALTLRSSPRCFWTWYLCTWSGRG